MALKTSSEGGIGLIEASGLLVGGEEIDKLRAAVADFVEKGFQKLVVDLGNVTFLNSSAIGVLVSAHTTYARKGWQLKLCGINRHINTVFVVTKLTLVFDFAETVQNALKNFK